ncbi:MAG: CHRD domain-containing protein [Acidimicrobiales bacterium]
MDIRFDNFAANGRFVSAAPPTTIPPTTSPPTTRAPTTTAAAASTGPRLVAQLTEVYDFPGPPDKGTVTLTPNEAKGEICYELKLRETDKPTATHIHEGVPGSSVELHPPIGTPGRPRAPPGRVAAATQLPRAVSRSIAKSSSVCSQTPARSTSRSTPARRPTVPRGARSARSAH